MRFSLIAWFGIIYRSNIFDILRKCDLLNELRKLKQPPDVSNKDRTELAACKAELLEAY